VSLAEKLIKDFEELPETQKREVIDFVEFLKIKNQMTISERTCRGWNRSKPLMGMILGVLA
jgi:uncharacterized protein YfbU (UPF0304 family)